MKRGLGIIARIIVRDFLMKTTGRLSMTIKINKYKMYEVDRILKLMKYQYTVTPVKPGVIYQYSIEVPSEKKERELYEILLAYNIISCNLV